MRAHGREVLDVRADRERVWTQRQLEVPFGEQGDVADGLSADDGRDHRDLVGRSRREVDEVRKGADVGGVDRSDRARRVRDIAVVLLAGDGGDDDAVR